MDADALRTRSKREAKRLGYTITDSLPPLGVSTVSRSEADIVERSLCLHVVAARAHGLDGGQASSWLERAGIELALCPSELEFLRGATAKLDYRLQVEANWVLAWSLGLFDSLEFNQPCPDDFVRQLPDLRVGEPGDSFRRRAKLRSEAESLAKADLAYCLHWAVRESMLRGDPAPGKLAPYVVVERHRAFTWLTSDEDWDEVTLDT